MSLDNLELLKKTIKQVSDDKLIETFSRGALKLNYEQIKTVSFAFWLCFMAETDLNDIIHKARDMARKAYPLSNQEEVDKVIKDMGFDFGNLEYFGQKISLYEKMYGKTDKTKLFWKINIIRNDLSHNRIDKLSYNGESLMVRETKEKITIDYFETSFKTDFSKSKFWNGLTPEEQKKIEETFNRFIEQNKTNPDQ